VSTSCELLELLDGRIPPGFDEFMRSLRASAVSLGTPVFLRTGFTAHKHGWRRTCAVTDLDALAGHGCALVEFSTLCDVLGLPTETWVVREWLDLDARTTAVEGLPIAPERRFFVAGGRVVCHHAYWPERALDGHAHGPAWRERLREANAVSEAEVSVLLPLAAQVARAFHGWSVDFARTRAGRWYAIDMALAETSYHPPGCDAADAPLVDAVVRAAVDHLDAYAGRAHA
jgi:hypothetical protein